MEVEIGLDLLIHPHMGFRPFSVLFRVELHPEQVGPQGQLDQVVSASLESESDDLLYKVFEYKIDVPLVLRCGQDCVLGIFFMSF